MTLYLENEKEDLCHFLYFIILLANKLLQHLITDLEKLSAL